MPTSDIADTRLVASALSGKQGAIEELIARYQHKAFAIALAVGVRRDSVPDVLQDAFVRAFRALPQLEAYGSYGSWFLAIVRNVARRSLREAPRGAASEDLDRLADRSRESHADTIERSDFNERLRREVDRLPEGIREAIFLYYYEGESVRRVAAALGTTTPAVKNRLQKGRDLLRDSLWRQLRDSLRDMLPSARESRRAARHLSLVVLTSLPAAWGTAAGASSGAPPAGTGAAAATGLSAPLQGIAIMSAKHITASVIGCAVLFWLGFANGYGDGTSALPPPPAAEPVAAVADPPRAIAPAGLAPAPEPAAVAAAPVEQPPEPPRLGAVRAHVAWEIDDRPVVGAIVFVRHRDSNPRLEEFLGVTDERGIAEIGGIPPGEVEVLSDRARPRARQRWTRIAAGETAEVLLRLPLGLTVDGIVVDVASAPVAGAEIRVSEAEFDGLHGHTVARSGPDGTFRIEGVERGRYVSARAEGWAPSSQRGLSGEPGSKVSLRLVLAGAGGTVMGRVADGSGAPVAGALVLVGSRETHGTGDTTWAAPVSARTDGDGAFEAPGIPPGPAPVAVRALGYGPEEVIVDVVAAGTSRVIVTLPPGVAIEGTVLGPDGAAVPSAEVVVGAAESRSPHAPDDLLVTRARTDESGRYRLEGLAAGTITVAVSAKGLGTARRTVEAVPGDLVALDVALPGSLEIAGRVVLEDGTPVEGWGVHGDGLVYQFTDAEGRFTFRDLDDRPYAIEVTERGHRRPCARVEGVPAGGDPLAITVLEADRSRSFASGTVVDPNGRRVRGATVECYLRDGAGLGLHARTDLFGGFRIGPMPAGTYRFLAKADDLPGVWTDDLTVAHGATLPIGEIHLRRPGFLAVEFRSRSGRTPEGLALIISDDAGHYSFRRVLSSDPHFRWPLLPGPHTITVVGKDELKQEIEIREGDRTAVEIDLDGVR